MLSSYERNVDFLELSIGSFPSKSRVRFTLREHILPHLKNAADKQTAVYTMKGKTAALHLHQLEIDEERDCALVLFHYTDTNLSDPAFKNIKSGNVRVAGKNQGEGIAVSAHMLIDLNTLKNQGASKHLALIESVPGISKTVLEKALNAFFFKIIARPQWTFGGKPDKQGKPCRPNFSISALAADNLKDGLAHRMLTGIKLITKTPQNDLDEDVLIPKENQISFKISKNLGMDSISDLLHRVSRKAKDEGYTILKVQYNDEFKGTKTGTFKSLDEEDLERAEGVFCKRAKIYFQTPIEQCQENVHRDMFNKLVLMLHKEGGKEYVKSNSEEVTETTDLS